MNNQCLQVMQMLKRRPVKGITQKDVLSAGIFRLAARVKDLRDRGIAIKTEIERGINQNGNRTRYARYRLN